MSDYKLLRVVVVICVTLVNTQTHRELFTGLKPLKVSVANRFCFLFDHQFSACYTTAI